MTENESVLRDIIIDGNGCDYDESISQSIFEEIQAYRAIGTVEKIKEELDRLRNDNECQGLYFTLEERKALAKQSRELSEYKAIGTVEELQKQKEYIDTINEVCSGYSAIGTIDEFKALKEKSVAKKVDVWVNGEEHCPCCDKNLTTFWGFANCFDCGQKLDWSE